MYISFRSHLLNFSQDILNYFGEARQRRSFLRGGTDGSINKTSSIIENNHNIQATSVQMSFHNDNFFINLRSDMFKNLAKQAMQNWSDLLEKKIIQFVQLTSIKRDYTDDQISEKIFYTAYQKDDTLALVSEFDKLCFYALVANSILGGTQHLVDAVLADRRHPLALYFAFVRENRKSRARENASKNVKGSDDDDDVLENDEATEQDEPSVEGFARWHSIHCTSPDDMPYSCSEDGTIRGVER